MGAPDRSHALRVARRVELKGGAGAILQAALLHDVGKPKEFGLFWRTWCVMVPDSVLGEATDRSSGPAWARHIHRHHEAMGRLRLLQAGASSELLELLSGKGERTALGWLREADDLG
ncbi:MAG: hypothetical protein VKO21_12295 [Candidatus Sericytochromatia bacterium]|nr:hypothetical protein [Candidatus Sericytochromatia bacterium]